MPGTLHPFTLRLAAVFALAGLGTAALAENAAAAAKPHATILSLKAGATNGFPLPSVGASVTVSVRVRNAKTCTFFAQRTTTSSLYAVATVGCSSGHATARLPAIPNNRNAIAKLTFAVRVKDAAGRTVGRQVTVHEVAAAAIPTAQLGIAPASLTSSGGTSNLTFVSTYATSCTLGSVPALWPDSDPMTVNCNGSYQVTIPPNAAAQQWTIVFTATGHGQAATAAQVLTQNGTAPTTTPSGQTSVNWGGYSIKPGPAFTEAGGDWIVPTANCHRTPNAGATTWVGIGGDLAPDGSTTGVLLQTGVTTDCSNGKQDTYAWWEAYPSSPNHSWPFKKMTVSPGDHISATVYQLTDGIHWETRVDDVTTHQSGVMVTGQGWGVLKDGTSTLAFQGSTVDLDYSGGTSAEWIEEDYAGATGNLVPLSDFGTVTFTNLTASPTGWTLDPTDAITLIDADGTPLAVPSPPAGDSSGFSIAFIG